MPCDHLLTHGVVVGMTGSGKTGLLMVLVEEALRSSVPVIMVDIKGDLPNLLLTFPNLAPEEFRPWVESDTRGKSNGAHGVHGVHVSMTPRRKKRRRGSASSPIGSWERRMSPAFKARSRRA